MDALIRTLAGLPRTTQEETPWKRLPLIDVAEPERIAALTEAPDTVSFRADAAENLDGLVPDIGLTGKYPCRSVYRPRSFASAGVAATLTHRFWDTIDGTSDHTGRRWIGVVMYDEHGFDCRMEVTLGADPIGCMVPFRHDNRRHLYVLDRPVQFMGEMEVLRISGTGDAGYRLERVRGHVTVSSAAEPGRAAAEPPLTVALRRFWQTYPRAVRVTGDEIAVELLPVPSGAARPGDEESWHRIYFWLGDDGYASSCAAATRAGSSSAARRRDT